MSDAQRALAVVARRQAGSRLSRADWTNVLSLELGWMTPAGARVFVAKCVDAGLLAEDGDALETTFDPDLVEVPRRFRIDDGVQVEAARSVDGFVAWVDRLAAHEGRDRNAILADVSSLQERMGGLVEAEAAVLLLAADAGIDVKDAAAQALERLRSTPV